MTNRLVKTDYKKFGGPTDIFKKVTPSTSDSSEDDEDLIPTS